MLLGRRLAAALPEWARTQQWSLMIKPVESQPADRIVASIVSAWSGQRGRVLHTA